MEELSRASGSVALSYGAHSNLCVNQINRHGTEAQKEKYLPDLVAGRKVGSLAMSEPGSGSDVVSMQLRADKIEGGWRLNGSKFWSVNSHLSSSCPTWRQYCMVGLRMAQPPPRSLYTPRHHPKRAPRALRGFSTHGKLDKFGMRGSDTCELVFDNCIVPAGRSCATIWDPVRSSVSS
jgi:isovaleryl-CoA dehydrogenase